MVEGRSFIQKLSGHGKVLAVVGQQGQKPGQFYAPYDLALDMHGNMYVTEPRPLNGAQGNNRVQKLSPAGKILAVWR